MNRRKFILSTTVGVFSLTETSRLLAAKPLSKTIQTSNMKYHIEDLGQPAHGDVYRAWRYGRHPQSGAPLAIGSLAKGGFVVVDPQAMTAFQVLAPKTLDVGWAVGQAPNGDIYQAETGRPGNSLYVWDWKGRQSRAVATLPGGWSFTLDVAPDGRVYLPDYQKNRMYRYDPATQQIEDLGDYNAFGQHIRNVYCGRDGLVYVGAITYGGVKNGSVVVSLDPQTGEKKVVDNLDESTQSHSSGGIAEDAQGRVSVPVGRGVETQRHEIVNARVEKNALPQREKHPGAKLILADGSALKEISGRSDLVIVDAAGTEKTLTVQREDSPLRLFSVAAGGGKVWLGTIIPLSLWSYDPAAALSTSYGNPTPVDGEIYSMVYESDKLFMASYPTAVITRLDNSLPPEKRIRQLGKIKSKGLPLHRPHGRTSDGKGNVFFAAHGGYGCEDSGISRIDAKSEEMVSWIFPDTNSDALVYCKKTGELLLSERRKGEGATRFTFISPRDGKVLSSLPIFPDVDGAGGGVISWLDSGGDWIYGLHAHSATLFAFSLKEKKIVAQQRELRLGEHYHNALVNGRDGRIWGLTNQGVYAATRDLKTVEMLAEMGELGGKSSYCFGTAFDENGALYFASNTHLMRMTSGPGSAADAPA